MGTSDGDTTPAPGIGRVTWLGSEARHDTAVHGGEAIRFRVGDVEFDGSHGQGSSPGRFLVRKHRPLVEAYLSALTAVQNPNVVEVGLADGGSLALAVLATEPHRHVGLELDPHRLGALDELIARCGAGDRFRTHFGVDQADRRRVAEIVDAEFGDAPLDVVIDDASHLLEPTRATFEVLFPRLRPGGVYLIEDWNWDHLLARGLAAAIAGEASEEHSGVVARLPTVTSERVAVAAATAPLSILVIELVLAQAESDEVVAGVEIGPWAVSVTRGPADLDHRSFRLTDHFGDHLRLHPREPGIGSVY